MDTKEVKELVGDLIVAMPDEGFVVNAMGPILQLRMHPERFHEIVSKLHEWALAPDVEEVGPLTEAITNLTAVIVDLTNNMPID